MKILNSKLAILTEVISREKNLSRYIQSGTAKAFYIEKEKKLIATLYEWHGNLPVLLDSWISIERQICEALLKDKQIKCVQISIGDVNAPTLRISSQQDVSSIFEIK